MKQCLLVGTLLAAAQPVEAQVRWDDALKVYWVTVHNDAGVAEEMRVEPGNRVIPKLNLVRVDTALAARYRYWAGISTDSPQPITALRIPCGASAMAQQLAGGDWNMVEEWGGQTYCLFYLALGSPDDSVVVTFTSALLPGKGTAIAVGGSTAPTWPTKDPTSETVALTPIVDSLMGDTPTGLVRRFAAFVPMHALSVVAQTGPGLTIIGEELTKICADTDWIEPGVCQTLKDQIAAALAAHSTAAAVRDPSSHSGTHTVRQNLNTFMQTLSAGRGTTIQQNAFAALNALGRTVRRGLD